MNIGCFDVVITVGHGRRSNTKIGLFDRRTTPSFYTRHDALYSSVND